MTGDLINGGFELIGSMFLTINLYRLFKDKCVKGVSILPAMFYAVWGFWNLSYYPSLGQWYSFFGGIGVFVVNSIWLFMTAYYYKGRNEDSSVWPSEASRKGYRKRFRIYVSSRRERSKKGKEGGLR